MPPAFAFFCCYTKHKIILTWPNHFFSFRLNEGPVISQSFTSGNCLTNEKYDMNEKSKCNKDVSPDIFSVYKKQSKDPFLGSYSNSPGSCTSSTCGHSRQTSKGSIKVVTKTPRSAMHTPISVSYTHLTLPTKA